jgi:hypothetical protein
VPPPQRPPPSAGGRRLVERLPGECGAGPLLTAQLRLSKPDGRIAGGRLGTDALPVLELRNLCMAAMMMRQLDHRQLETMIQLDHRQLETMMMRPSPSRRHASPQTMVRRTFRHRAGDDFVLDAAGQIADAQRQRHREPGLSRELKWSVETSDG